VIAGGPKLGHIWRPTAPIITRNKRVKDGLLLFERTSPLHTFGSFVHVAGSSTLVPHAEDALAAIKAEQGRINQTATAERRKRKRDEAEAAALSKRTWKKSWSHLSAKRLA
jgi:hypothetical protein